MRKGWLIICLCIGMIQIHSAAAPAKKRMKTRGQPRTEAPISMSSSDDEYSSSGAGSTSGLSGALALAKAGRYKEASMQLFQYSYSPRFADKRMQIKYLLGLMLYQMKLNQVAAFQFISIIKDGNNKFLRQSLEKLSLAADALGDDTLLNYAISRISIDEFPRANRDMVYYRIGEFQLRNQQFEQAARTFAAVQPSSSYYPKTKYLEGLAWAEAKNPAQAVRSFDQLIASRENEKVTDVNRVAGLMGKARSLYQKKDWDGAIETYREVPRDSEMWHDTLFESSWAMLRSGRFRSAISNFHSLHSNYYETNYLPESLLLRSIVYLYICKYEEMEKVLNLFSRIYKPVYRDVENLLSQGEDPLHYYNDVVKAIREYKKSGDEINKRAYKIPFVVIRKIAKEADFHNSFSYIKKLITEQKMINAMPPDWRGSSVGKYALRVVQNRLRKAQLRAGMQIKAHLELVREELVDLFEQEGFIRYEMINGRKENLKKRLAGKDVEQNQIDEKNKRDYYVQNGWEYWPFRGEYWLDELGNYHYVGTQSCE